MAKQFWEDDAKAASGEASSETNFWEGDADAAKQDLPKDVKPSKGGGGRGSVNPPTIAAMQSEADMDKPAGAMGATIRKNPAPPPDKRSLLERSVEGDTEGQRASLVRQERRSNWEQDQINLRSPSATGTARQPTDAAFNRGGNFAASWMGDNPVGRVGAKVVTGLAQGSGGLVQAAGDLIGNETMANVGRATAEGAEAFEKGMGKGGDIAGFGPRSPLPYLAEQAGGAASSLGQSAALASMFGPRGVIAAQAILQGGQSYNEARQAGMDPATALARAVPQGAFEAIGEKFQGLDKLTGAMGTLLQRGASDSAKRTAADVLVRAGIREVPGEVLTYLGQTGTDLIPGIGLNPNLTMSQFLQGLGDTVVQSMMMGGATAGTGHAAGGQLNRPAQPSAADLARSKGFLMPAAAQPSAEAGNAAQGAIPAVAAAVPPAASQAAPAPVPTPTPEPPADTAAQIAAIRNPKSGKTAALITPNSPATGIDLSGLQTVNTPLGTFVTGDENLARAVAARGSAITDAEMGQFLGYTTPKGQSDGTVVQALDPAGNVVHEEATNAQNLPVAAAQAADMVPSGGTLRQTDAATVQAERQERMPGALTRAAMAAGNVTPDGRPTAMNDPKARPKTFAEQQSAMDAVAALEAEQDAQADFEAAMLGDQTLPDNEPTTKKGAQDAPAKSPAPGATKKAAATGSPTKSGRSSEGSGLNEPAGSQSSPPPATRAADRAEPAADAPGGEARATYSSLAEATAYIRKQRARGSNVAAAAYITPDGEIVVATKGTPEYEQALDQRQARLKGEQDAGRKGGVSAAAADSRRAGGDSAAGSVADGRGADAAPARPVPGAPDGGGAAGLAAAPGNSGDAALTRQREIRRVMREQRVGVNKAGQIVDEAAAQKKEAPPHDRPLAAEGLNSYRYKGPMGWVMIGAKDDADALKQAKASITDKSHEPALDRLERWDGKAYAPAVERSVDAAANEAATSPQNSLPEPTQAQKEAGNYKMGHLSGEQTQGVDITIENPKGSVRSGTAPDGTKWSNTMGAHYGYAKRSQAADGDHVDVFVGPAPERAPTVYLIDQVNADGTYDEAKAMFGFMNKASAIKAYRDSYSKGWKVGPVTAMPVAEFKAGLESGRFAAPVDPELASRTATNATENATQQPQSETNRPENGKSAAPTVTDAEGKTYPTKGEALPKSGVAPANLGSNGTVYVGRRNGQHFEIAKAFPHEERGDFKSTGFVNPDGQYLTREQALAWVEKNEKAVKPADNMEGALDALDYREQVPEAERAGKGGKKQGAKRETKAARSLRERDEARAAYFAPGNVVRSYGGNFDRVVRYNAPAQPGGDWSVTVRTVKKTGPATFEDIPNERERTHATLPSAAELRVGPAGRMDAPAGESRPAENGDQFGEMFHGTAMPMESFEVGRGGGAGYHHQGPAVYLTDDRTGLARFFAGAAAVKAGRRDKTLTEAQQDAIADSGGVVMNVKVSPDARILDMRAGKVPPEVQSLFDRSVGDRAVGEQLRDKVMELGYDGIAFLEPNRPEGWETKPDAVTLAIYRPEKALITGNSPARPATAEQGTMFSVAEQTDTPAFKRWFGDSKVVDDEGKPLVLYHGTPAKGLSIFDASKIGTNGRAEGAGFYFTTDKKTADSYGQRGETLQVYLNIRKPLAYDAKPFSALQMQKVLTEVAKAEAMDTGTDWKDGFLSNYVDTYSKSFDAATREAARSFVNDETALDQISGIVGAGVDAETVNTGLTKALGYDGYVSKGFSGEGKGGGDIWVAMRSEQVKSATANSGAFDAKNPDIRMRTSDGAGQAVKTKPASTEHEAKANRLLTNLQAGQEGYLSFQAVEPDDSSDAGKMLAATRLTAKRLFGHDVVFVRFNGPAAFNGAMSTSMPNTVFIRVDSSKPHLAILGHELLHSLRASNPGLYAAMEHRLNQLTNDKTTGFYRELKAKYDAIGRTPPEGSKLREELYADIVGDNFLSPEFWSGMAADQRGLFRRVADAIVRFLDRVIGLLANSNALGTREMLKDAEEARRVVIAGMRAFSDQARARSGLPALRGADALAATSRKPAGAVEFTRDSKVKHVVYHATNADFNVFDTTMSDLGAHFGTLEQANKVAETRLFGRKPGAGPSVMPVYLNLRSPLRLKDVGTFHADGIAPQLAAKGWMTKAEAKAIVSAIDRDWNLREKYDKQMRELIQSEGYDGVVYKNTHEGDGDSYIVFKPEQVKSAIGNNGAFDKDNPDIRMSVANVPKTVNPALSRAIFGGSMEYMRDQNGKPVKVKDQVEKYKAIDTDERGQMLLRKGYITADQLKHWKESPLDVYDGAVNNRFRKHFEAPGIVWRDEELRNIFKLDDDGIAAYRALRAQADESIARHAVAAMLRLAGPDGLAVREQVLAEPMDVAAITLRDHLLELADQKRAPAAPPKVQMTDKERNEALAKAVKLEGEAEALSKNSPDKQPAAALAKIDEAKKLRADVGASIASPGKLLPEAKVLMDRADAVINMLDQANDDMNGGVIPDDMKAEARPNPWESTTPTVSDRIIYEFQDGRIDLKRTQEAIERSGAKIREEFDARLAETLYSGRMAKRTQAFLEKEAKPLLQAMALQRIGQVELGDYLHARAAPERNAQIAKVNPDMPDGGAGSNSQGLLLTTAAARKYIADIPADRRAKLEALAQRVDAITKGTRSLLVAEGLEKADTIAAWEHVYKTYVPMFREDVEFSRITNSKRATGSEKKAVNILANVLLQREAAITRAEKNRVKVALYGLALTNPNPDFWVTIRPETDRAQIAEDLKRMGIDSVEAEAGMAKPPTITTVDPVTNLVVEQLDQFYRDLPTAINLKINGEHRVLLLNEEDPRALRMAMAMKGSDNLTQFDLAGSLVGKTTRWLAAVNTQYNPVFGIVNFMRDTMGGVIHLGNTELRGSSAKVVAGLPGALKGIAAHLAGSHDSGKWSRLFEQFQQDGGQTGFREMFEDGTKRAEAVERDLKKMGQSKVDPRRIARNMLSLLSGFNEVTENAVRLSAYAAALDKGISRPEAARLARELTVDFNRKGRATREIGPLYAFFNAAVQGNERTLRALRGPTGKYIIAGGLALGVAQALMLAAAGIDDDEIPDYAKARALVIPLFNKEKSYILVPLPLGLHVIPNTGRVITEMILGDGKNLGKKTVDAIGEISGAFNPLGGGNVFTMDGALRTLMPTIIDPLIELGFNKNFAGQQIERDPRGESDVRPGYQRARESTQKRATGQAYLGISKAMNWATGGTDYEAGAISPTPERIRYVSQVALGGVLRETEKIIDTSVAAARGEKTTPNNIPVASRFYGKVDEDRVEQSRYFNNKRTLEKLRNAEKGAMKAGNEEGVAKLRANPLHSVLKPAARIDRSIQALNKMAVQVIGNPEEQKAIDDKRTQEMKTLNEAIKAIEQSQRSPTLAERMAPTPAP